MLRRRRSVSSDDSTRTVRLDVHSGGGSTSGNSNGGGGGGGGSRGNQPRKPRMNHQTTLALITVDENELRISPRFDDRNRTDDVLPPPYKAAVKVNDSVEQRGDNGLFYSNFQVDEESSVERDDTKSYSRHSGSVDEAEE